MTIIHIVQVNFNPEINESSILDICHRLLDLKNKCINLTTKEPYIKSLRGGQDVSIENAQNGFTHGFVAEFENEEDRDFYVKQDEVHLKFLDSVKSSLAGLQVIDFVPGKF